MIKVSAVRSASNDVFTLLISTDTTLTDIDIKGILRDIQNSIGVSDAVSERSNSPTDRKQRDGDLTGVSDANET